MFYLVKFNGFNDFFSFHFTFFFLKPYFYLLIILEMQQFKSAHVTSLKFYRSAPIEVLSPFQHMFIFFIPFYQSYQLSHKTSDTIDHLFFDFIFQPDFNPNIFPYTN